MTTKLEVLEEQSLLEEDYPEVPPSDIVAYNELRSCADLYRMHQQKILEIHPDFQRDVVWQSADQTRFIDSLIKQLPIPSMCFALDHKKQKWMVIDGLQRMHTIVRFLEGGDWTLSSLDDIDPKLAGKSVAAIKTSSGDLHDYYSRVENLSIPITVLRCDFSKKSHLEYLFTIFHRLNAGGVKLNNQEIRNCIYSGGLNTLLKELDKFPAWRSLNKMKVNNTYRFTKQEHILRFLAFEEQYGKYQGHLAKFLNDYMHDHRDPPDEFLTQKRALFTKTITCLFEKAFGGTAPSKTPTTIIEGAMVGVGRNIDGLMAKSAAEVSARYQKMATHQHFSVDSLTEGLSKKPKVLERLDTAVKIFSGK